MKIMKRFLLALLVATAWLVGLVVLAKPFSFSSSVPAQTPLTVKCGVILGHKEADLGGREELTGTLSGAFREFPEKLIVGAAQEVGLHVG